MNQRVVITGMGAISPLGVGVPALWEGLLAGRSGISAITAFDTSAYEVHRGGVIRGFDGASGLDRAFADDIGQAARLAIAA
ncbi:MAG: beta-ketoacyl synthase N-terminal-like domain-containing protein, partial [Candidatus Sericytochromatia bacterium]